MTHLHHPFRTKCIFSSVPIPLQMPDETEEDWTEKSVGCEIEIPNVTQNGVNRARIHLHHLSAATNRRVLRHISGNQNAFGRNLTITRARWFTLFFIKYQNQKSRMRSRASASPSRLCPLHLQVSAMKTSLVLGIFMSIIPNTDFWLK